MLQPFADHGRRPWSPRVHAAFLRLVLLALAFAGTAFSPNGAASATPQKPRPRPRPERRFTTMDRPQQLPASRRATATAANGTSQADASGGSSGTSLTAPDPTAICKRPMPCTEYLSPDLPCMNLPRSEAHDAALGVMVCSVMEQANGFDPNYVPQTGVATTRCIADWKGDGRCDLPNNHANEGCEYDGGDCCLATCQGNCAQEPDLYSRSSNCQHFCGEMSNYMCLDDEALYSPISQWCYYGSVRPMSQCYYSKLDVVQAMMECILSDRAHGNEVYASAQCGNQTLTCTEADVLSENGCHLKKDECFARPCCTMMISNEFIEARPSTLPTLAELWDACEYGYTDDDEPCWKALVMCIQENRAATGGCCQCDPGWSGWRCRWPLCWPKCVHGVCVSPNLCQCDPGWKGDDCTHAICENECVAGQGTCVLPNTCECFYGWTGEACESPVSVPACVNGEAVAPDICHCIHGWGGRICDYPLCLSYPDPSADCGHGSCVDPFNCECEPGWRPYQPLNGTGFDIPPYYSVGQDVSVQTQIDGYVYADSRLVFVTRWERVYNSSSAYRCIVPDCAHIYDARCISCEMPPGRCTLCEPGYFVNASNGRCERCSNVFPHCQLCGLVNMGPSGQIVLRCTHCDPMFILQPVAFGAQPSARCVSDAGIEFGSPVYHVFKDARVLNLTLHRHIYATDPVSANGVEVRVRTRDGTAHSRSLEYGGGLANFEFTVTSVEFGINEFITLPSDAQDSPLYDEAMELRVPADRELRIPIYDDVSFHEGLRYFDIEITLSPEHISGHMGALYPFIPVHGHEVDSPWLAPQDVGRSPILDRQDALASARVYIWDREEATAVNSTCAGACQDWDSPFEILQVRSLTITARTHEGNISTSPRDQFLTIYRPMSRGFEAALGTVSWAPRVRGVEGTFYSMYTPNTPGPYKVIVEKVVQGVRSQYWWHRRVHHNPPQLPDTERIDHILDFYWPDRSNAPAFARWDFHVHFECIQSQTWPFNFGHALGIIASPGSTIAAYFWNDGLVEQRQIPTTAPTWSRYDINRTACDRRADGGPMYDYFMCIEMLHHNPMVTPFGVYAFSIEFTTEVPSLISTEQPAYISISLYHNNDTDHWGWWPVKQECLLTSGFNIQGSPFEGFEALSGAASPIYSTVTTLDGTTEEIETRVGDLTQLRIDLRDHNNVQVMGGEALYPIFTAELQTSTGILDMAAQIHWNGDFYLVSFVPELPTAEQEDLDAGFYTRYLHAILTGVPMRFSPIRVTIFTALSSPLMTNITLIDGRNYTPVQVSEYLTYQIQAADARGYPRTTGGDHYDVIFDGPKHDPLPQESSFTGSVVDNLDGTYNVTFYLMRPGFYDMTVLQFGEHIFGSPFRDVLCYDIRSAPLTTASGPGVGSIVNLGAGLLTTFVVTVRDTYGVQYFMGEDELQISIDSMSASRGDVNVVTDYGNGQYGFEYSVCQAGRTNASVMLFGIGYQNIARWRPIAGSPFIIEVYALWAFAATSSLHALDALPQSGMPTSARISLRDHCGNLPGQWAATNLSVRVDHLQHGFEVPMELMPEGTGEATVFFTPGRRGQHSLSVKVNGLDVQGSPLIFEVEPSMGVPPGPGTAWVTGAVGASELSVFQVFGSPAIAGAEPALFQVQAIDLWDDPLARGNDTFLMGVWREGGPCPAPRRCLFFSASPDTCGKVPSCYFDPVSATCFPRCIPQENVTGGRLGLETEPSFSLVDPESTSVLQRAEGDMYEFAVSTTVAGTYQCTLSVLRPGGLIVHYFDNELMTRCLHIETLQGPFDFNWGLSGPSPRVPSMRFSARALGWLRVLVQDRYMFKLESDGAVRLVIDGVELINVPSAHHREGTATAEVELRPGFASLQVDYIHGWRGSRAVPSYLRLRYHSPSIALRTVLAEDMYYEEVLSTDQNPFTHIVHPASRAVSLAVAAQDGVAAEMPAFSGTAGEEMTFRLLSIDTFGNLLTMQDPTASVHLLGIDGPTLPGGEFMENGSLVAMDNSSADIPRWKVIPLADGSWQVALVPDVAPAVYNLTFELRTLEEGGVAFSRRLRVSVEQNRAHASTSWVSCWPPPPQLVGTAVTCTVVPQDVEGNELANLDVRLEAQPPNSSEAIERSEAWPVDNDVARSFLIRPFVPGNWTVHTGVMYPEGHFISFTPVEYQVLPGLASSDRAGSEATVPDVYVTTYSFNINLTLRDEYGNLAEEADWMWRARIYGGDLDNYSQYGAVVPTGPNTYRFDMPALMQRDIYVLNIDHLDAQHNSSLVHCPELVPLFGRVRRLTRHRALGSHAVLECLPGYRRASGSATIRCEQAPAHKGARLTAGEWIDQRYVPASPLVCRPIRKWCPTPSFVNAEIAFWDWRREVGSHAVLRCLEGHKQLFGDLELVCGSRDGRGVWLHDGASGGHSVAVGLVCVPEQHTCLQPMAVNGSVANLSAGREAGSVVLFQCNPGFEPVAGHQVASCGADGVWKRPDQVYPPRDAEQFQCGKRVHFCPDPEILLETGVRVKGAPDRSLHGNVELECIEGYQTLRGEAMAVCSWGLDDSSVGTWMSMPSSYRGQVALQPLRCTLIQDWCPPIVVTDGLTHTLSDEFNLFSVAELRCAIGFEPSAGHERFHCGYNTDRTSGAWHALDGSGISNAVQCSKIADFCPPPVAVVGTNLRTSNGRRIDSVLSFECGNGYEDAVPRELSPLLICMPMNSTAGNWSTQDGLPVPTLTLKCRGRQNWCPELDGRAMMKVKNYVGARRPGSTATLTCYGGFQLYDGLERLDAELDIVCQADADNPYTGTWRRLSWDNTYVHTFDVACYSVQGYCPEVLAYTRVDGGPEQLMEPYQYSVSFTAGRTYDSIASLRCNPWAEYNYSYGDTYIKCGFNAENNGGAWRSVTGGHLAVPLRCYFAGSSVQNNAAAQDGCFEPNTRLQYNFGREGTIMLWVRPSEFLVGATILEGEQGDGKWQIKFVDSSGLLNAQIAPGVGQVEIDITQNGTKAIYDWYHLALVWEVGPGLGGRGDMRLYVDGFAAVPVSYRSERVDHFSWVDPGNMLHIANVYSQPVPAQYSNLRIYGRPAPELEILMVRESEDPRCGLSNFACVVPPLVHAHIVNVDNVLDPRYALIARRQESQVRIECDPGYVRSDGDYDIQCMYSGVWVRLGTTEAASPLRCCNTEKNWCPEINMEEAPLSLIAASAGSDTVPCVYTGTSAGMGITFVGCPPIIIADGTVNDYAVRVVLRCNAGFRAAREMAMDDVLECVQAQYDPAVHLDARVPSMWITQDGRPGRPLQCTAIQNWCGDPQLPFSRVVGLTDGSRVGSMAVLECLTGYQGLWLNYFPVTIGPVSLEILCQGNGWTAPQLGADVLLSGQQCNPIAGFCPLDSLVPMTAAQGIPEPMAAGTFTRTFDNYGLGGPGELRSSMTLRCMDPYVYSYGDTEVHCAYGEGGTSGVWLGPGGKPAVPVHCRDTRPAVQTAIWFENTCLGDGPAPIYYIQNNLKSEGTVSLWVRLPNISTTPEVVWCTSDPPTTTTTSTGTSTTTLTSTTSSGTSTVSISATSATLSTLTGTVTSTTMTSTESRTFTATSTTTASYSTASHTSDSYTSSTTFHTTTMSSSTTTPTTTSQTITTTTTTLTSTTQTSTTTYHSTTETSTITPTTFSQTSTTSFHSTTQTTFSTQSKTRTSTTTITLSSLTGTETTTTETTTISESTQSTTFSETSVTTSRSTISQTSTTETSTRSDSSTTLSSTSTFHTTTLTVTTATSVTSSLTTTSIHTTTITLTSTKTSTLTTISFTSSLTRTTSTGSSTTLTSSTTGTGTATTTSTTQTSSTTFHTTTQTFTSSTGTETTGSATSSTTTQSSSTTFHSTTLTPTSSTRTSTTTRSSTQTSSTESTSLTPTSVTGTSSTTFHSTTASTFTDSSTTETTTTTTTTSESSTTDTSTITLSTSSISTSSSSTITPTTTSASSSTTVSSSTESSTTLTSTQSDTTSTETTTITATTDTHTSQTSTSATSSTTLSNTTMTTASSVSRTSSSSMTGTSTTTFHTSTVSSTVTLSSTTSVHSTTASSGSQTNSTTSTSTTESSSTTPHTTTQTTASTRTSNTESSTTASSTTSEHTTTRTSKSGTTFSATSSSTLHSTTRSSATETSTSSKTVTYTITSSTTFHTTTLTMTSTTTSATLSSTTTNHTTTISSSTTGTITTVSSTTASSSTTFHTTSGTTTTESSTSTDTTSTASSSSTFHTTTHSTTYSFSGTHTTNTLTSSFTETSTTTFHSTTASTRTTVTTTATSSTSETRSTTAISTTTISTTGITSTFSSTTSISSTYSSSTTSGTTTTMTSTTSDLPCGPQRMIIKKGILRVQLGDGIADVEHILMHDGRYVEDQWVHIAYTWSYSNNDVRLYVDGRDLMNLPSNSTDYLENPGLLNGSLSFWIYLDGPRDNARVYDRALSGSEVMTLYEFEGSDCISEANACPEPPIPYESSGSGDKFRRSHVIGASSSDPIVPPYRNRPGTLLHLSCDLGYVQTGGDASVECSSQGVWVRPGTNLTATWLECCAFAQGFCGDVVIERNTTTTLFEGTTSLTATSTQTGTSTTTLIFTVDEQVFFADAAFLALNQLRGTGQCWGNAGLVAQCSLVDFSGVNQVFSAGDKFFAIDTRTGTDQCWGSSDSLSDCASVDFSGVTHLHYTTSGTFLALSVAEGTGQCWGTSSSVWPCATVDFSGVTQVLANGDAFLALNTVDGTGQCWGNPFEGGDCSSIIFTRSTSISSTERAFLAFSATEGTGQCWGFSVLGGDCTSVDFSNVTQVFSNDASFLALNEEHGTGQCWGASVVCNGVGSVDFSGVTHVFLTNRAALALSAGANTTGQCWGNVAYGGDCASVEFSAMTQVFFHPFGGAFVALNAEEGSGQCWGNAASGGDCASIDFTGVTHVFSTEAAFLALNLRDGTGQCWGDPAFGGDCASVGFGYLKIRESDDRNGTTTIGIGMLPYTAMSFFYESVRPMDACDEDGGLNFSTEVSYTLDARARFKCPVGYAQVGGSRVASCVSGSVGGQWVDNDAAEFERANCELDEAFCPLVEGFASYVVNVTSGRQINSMVFFMCWPNHIPYAGNVTLRCVAREDGETGYWADAAGREAVPLRCVDAAAVYTPGAEAPMFNESVTLDRRFNANASIVCLSTSSPFHGDDPVFCALGPSTAYHHGAGGRWADENGMDAEFPLCELKEDWCPMIPLNSHSATFTITDGYRYGSEATIRCQVGYKRLAGNEMVRCVNNEYATAGQWDRPPLSCELDRHFCPPFRTVNATVMENPVRYWLHEIVTFMCLPGYQYLSGDANLTCGAGPAGTQGEWKRLDGRAAQFLVCSPIQDYCQAPLVEHGYAESFSQGARLGSVAELRCHAGYLDPRGSMDRRAAVCNHYHDTQQLSGLSHPTDGTYSLQTASGACRSEAGHYYSLGSGDSSSLDACLASCDSTPGCHAVTFRVIPSALIGIVPGECYLETEAATVTSEIELQCWEKRKEVHGAFFVGMSFASRDILRAVSFMTDLLSFLRAWEALPYRLEDDSWDMRLYFEERWRAELRDALAMVRDDRYVVEVFRRFLPDYIMSTGEHLSHFTIDHVRIARRLLVATAEEYHDVSAQEARAVFGAYDKLKINFQDRTTSTPPGWLRDAGELFGDRGNGFTYGWKCDVSNAVANLGALNRNLSAYTVLENTLVASDPNSACDGQEWRIRLPASRYRVEVTMQDPQFTFNASGCLVQGEPLGLPETMQPPGRPERQRIIVDVLDLLSITCDFDGGCAGLNRISIQNVKSAGVRGIQSTKLRCEAIQEWCPSFVLPLHGHPPSEVDIQLAKPLGSDIELECDKTYVYEQGARQFFCGATSDGRQGLWRDVNRVQIGLPMTCAKNRTWCPPLAVATSSVVSSEPYSYELGARVLMACPDGFERIAGDSEFECVTSSSEDAGEWCPVLRPAGQTPGAIASAGVASCTGSVTLLECAPKPLYCPSMQGVGAGTPIVEGLRGAEGHLPYHATTVATTVMLVGTGMLGDEASFTCPPHYHRVQGDDHVVCDQGTTLQPGTEGIVGHESSRRGVWQPVGADTTFLVDDASAEPLLCELDVINGLERRYFTSVGQLFEGPLAAAGKEVVPNIDQVSAVHEAALFEGHLRPENTSVYTFSVEVVGSFVFAIGGEVVLTGKSIGGPIPQNFTAADNPLTLQAAEFYELSLQYSLDPDLMNQEQMGALPPLPSEDVRLVPRHVRLFWAVPGDVPSVVPPTVLYRGWRDMYSFPRPLRNLNDLTQCTSGETYIPDVVPGNTGMFWDGSPTHNYNHDTVCTWRLRANSLVTYNVYVNYLDLEESPGCEADRVEVWRGSVGQERAGSACGRVPGGTLLTSQRIAEITIRFITDGSMEAGGFNLTWVVADGDSPILTGIVR